MKSVCCAPADPLANKNVFYLHSYSKIACVCFSFKMVNMKNVRVCVFYLPLIPR